MADSEFLTNPKNVAEWVEVWNSGKYEHFHKPIVSKYITNQYEALVAGKKKVKVFFPLCGRDAGMKWLADKGHTVVGLEGSESAVKGFFTEQQLDYTTEPVPELDGQLYKSVVGDLRIYCGDFFKFKCNIEKGFDGVWDRGGFGALEPCDRQRYADIILSQGLLTSDCRYLLETFEGQPEEGLVSEDLLKKIFKIGERFTMERVEYEKEEEDAPGDGYIMMIQVHVLTAIP